MVKLSRLATELLLPSRGEDDVFAFGENANVVANGLTLLTLSMDVRMGVNVETLVKFGDIRMRPGCAGCAVTAVLRVRGCCIAESAGICLVDIMGVSSCRPETVGGEMGFSGIVIHLL